MKKQLFYFLCLTLLIGFSACNSKKTDDNELSTDIVKNSSSAQGDDENMPLITFDKETHDFGKIKETEKVSFSFKFKNTGKSDLIITDARGSCGCTVPNYPTKPMAPGEEGVIDVTFDSSGKAGKQSKTVTVLTNSNPSTKVLTILAEVEPLTKQ